MVAQANHVYREPRTSPTIWTQGTPGTRSFQYYYPYGEPRDTYHSNLPSDHSYTAQITDGLLDTASNPNNDGTGLMYYNARYYNPQSGSFTQPDSLIPDPAYPADYNRYAYVLGNPANLTDPTGHGQCIADTDICGGQGMMPLRGKTAHGQFIDALWSLWYRALQIEDEIDSFELDPMITPTVLEAVAAERDPNPTTIFISLVSRYIAGLQPGAILLPEGWPNGPRREEEGFAGEILGASGWDPALVDLDPSTARHFSGWLVLGYFYETDAAKTALLIAEGCSELGCTRQDIDSGMLAITLGDWLHATGDVPMLIMAIGSHTANPGALNVNPVATPSGYEFGFVKTIVYWLNTNPFSRHSFFVP